MWRDLVNGFRALVGRGGPSGNEARDRARVLCRYPVGCTPGNFEAFVVDISRTGMRLEGVSSLRAGERVSLAYRPYPGGDPPPENAGPVEVEVVWCRKRSHDGKLLAGVRYAGPVEASWVHHVFLEVGLAREQTGAQKRKHLRLATALRAEIRDKHTGQYLGEGKVANLSLGGVLVQSATPLSENQLVLVLIAPYNNFPILSLTGSILNCRPDLEEDMLLASIQFVNVSPAEARTLKRYIFKLLQGRSIG